MVIIKVANEVGECVIGVVDVCLALTLDVIYFKWIKDFMLQDIFCIGHLVPLFNLGRMVLDPPWYFGCSCVLWQSSRLWGAGWAYKFLLSDRPVCGLLHCYPKETMMSATNFGLNGWGIVLDLAVNLAYDLVVDDPLEFRDRLEREFSENVLGFGSHFWFLFLQIRWYDPHRVSNTPCLVAFGFLQLGGLSCLGDWIHRV